MTRIADAQIERARTRYRLSALIGRDIKLVRRGGEFVGLCPFHKERTASFTIVDDKGFYHCFGCGAHGDAIRWRIEMHGDSFPDAVALLTGEAAPSEATAMRETAARGVEDAARNLRHEERARQLWRCMRNIVGTPGEAYFRARDITIPLPPTLGYDPECLHPTGVRLPAVICAVQDVTGRVVAVHRLFLDPASLLKTPRKTSLLPDKALLGSPGDGSIRLAPAAPSMGRCEGVETGLSVQQATDIAVWSAISGGHMAKQEFPRSVKAVVTFADRDRVSWRPGPLYGRRPGEHYAQLAAERDRAAGRRALIARPFGDKEDYNDTLQEAG